MIQGFRVLRKRYARLLRSLPHALIVGCYIGTTVKKGSDFGEGCFRIGGGVHSSNTEFKHLLHGKGRSHGGGDFLKAAFQKPGGLGAGLAQLPQCCLALLRSF